jgi:hypothetical protein
VDIQGDTEIELTLPYSEREASRAVGAGSKYGLYVKALAFSTPDPSLVNPVYINVYKAAGPDYRVAVAAEYTFTPTHNPRADFVKDFPALQESMTGYAVEGLLYGESYTTIREILHRYAPIAVVGGNDSIWTTTGSGAALLGPELWSLLYRFKRGSMRMKYVLSSTRFPEVVTLSTSTGALPGAYVSTPGNPVLDVEIPYYSNRLFESTNSISGLNVITSTATTKYLMKAVGDDFSFHWIRAPPDGSFGLATLTGTPGIRTWASGVTP